MIFAGIILDAVEIAIAVFSIVLICLLAFYPFLTR